MTDDDKPLHKHHRTARNHLAGIHGAEKEIQDLAAQHLLRTQSPVRDQPVTPETEAPQ